MPRDKEAIKEERIIATKVTTLIDGERIINFSDAVFAFAATLLVLKIDLPQIPPELIERQFFSELVKLLPTYLANFVSFLIIAYYWRQHHKLFILIKRYDSTIVWMNILVLIFVSFLPFPIDLVGEYPDARGVVVFYTVCIALVGLMLFILWRYAARSYRLIDKSMGNRLISYHDAELAVAPIVFLLSIPLVYFDPLIAKVSWIFVIIGIVFVNRFYNIRKLRDKAYVPEPE